MKISCKNVMHLVLMNLCCIFAEFWNFTNVNTLALELNVRSIPQCQFCLPQNLLKPLRNLIFGRHLKKNMLFDFINFTGTRLEEVSIKKSNKNVLNIERKSLGLGQIFLKKD